VIRLQGCRSALQRAQPNAWPPALDDDLQLWRHDALPLDDRPQPTSLHQSLTSPAMLHHLRDFVS
jgi:hypothetical protein